MNMALQRHVVVLLLLACLFTSSYSYQFMVGGKDGWVPNPSVSYNTWSQHMRFQINDSVLFKYKQGADSVLEVNKDDYDKCNTGNPIKKMEDGNSIFTLDRSGPFYFISGNKDNCDKGQKVQIVVISVRNQGKPPSTSPPAPKTPAPGAAPPTASPPSPPSGGSSPAAAPPKGSSTPSAPSANSPAAAPPTGSSSPGSSSPNGAPISTPAGNTPTVSPPAPATGGSTAPAMAPVANGPSTNAPGSSSPAAGGPSGSMSPAGGPSAGSLAPAAGGPAAGSLAPAGGPAAGGPSAGGPAAGSLAPAGGPAAGGPSAGGPAAGAPGGAAAGSGGNTPADINSPAGSPENPNSFAVKAFTQSTVLVSAVSLVLTVALGEIIILP